MRRGGMVAAVSTSIRPLGHAVCNLVLQRTLESTRKWLGSLGTASISEKTTRH